MLTRSCFAIRPPFSDSSRRTAGCSEEHPQRQQVRAVHQRLRAHESAPLDARSLAQSLPPPRGYPEERRCSGSQTTNDDERTERVADLQSARGHIGQGSSDPDQRWFARSEASFGDAGDRRERSHPPLDDASPGARGEADPQDEDRHGHAKARSPAHPCIISAAPILERVVMADPSTLPVTTAPWPGPGNSEGPADPDGSAASVPRRDGGPSDWTEPLPVEALPPATTPWPGPGNSEGGPGG